MVQFGEVSAWASECEPLTTDDSEQTCHLLPSGQIIDLRLETD